MTTTTDSLGDRLRRVAMWADAVPSAHRTAASLVIDRAAVALAHLCAETSDDPLVADITRTECDQ